MTNIEWALWLIALNLGLVCIQLGRIAKRIAARGEEPK
jgi:hypothetical protein